MDKLTKQELSVLEHFISEEGYVKQGFTLHKHIHLSDNKLLKSDHYYAYAKKVSDDMSKRVTRGWAMAVCKRLEELGVMDHKLEKPTRQKNMTEYYYLKSDMESLKKVTKILLNNIKDISKNWWMFQGAYFWKTLDTTFVREVFSKKKLILSRSIDLIYWDEPEAIQLFKTHKEKVKKNYGSHPKYYSRYDPGDTFKEYVNRLIALYKTGKRYSDFWDPPRISLYFPVFSDKDTMDKRVEAFNRLNKDTLAKYPSLSFYSSAVQRHYMEHEIEHLILPIQVLIRISPNALAHFLDNDWEPPTGWYCMDDAGITHIRYLLYRLLFIAINDQAIIRTIQSNDVNEENAYIRNQHNARDRDRYTPLLSVDLKMGGSMCYDGGFDTQHTFIGDESGDVWEPDEETNYWAEAWIDHSYKYGYDYPRNDWHYVTGNNVIDPASLVEKLKSSRQPLVEYIRNKFSIEARHILRYYEPEGNTDEYLLRKIVDELNRIIVMDNIYDVTVFKDVVLGQEIERLLENIKREQESPYGLQFRYQVDDLNRHLVDLIFSNEIKKYEDRYTYIESNTDVT